MSRGSSAESGEGNEEEERAASPRPSRWREAGHRAALSTADAAGPLLLVLMGWWVRTH
ncbi:hypothetical protein [Streptomyces sp. NPDC047123]|uniref:hypothetical protein n=1 Tax=Streptomyces sp. NPDC047123 TaxID=3155622 RepID=UPI0033FDE115